MTDLSLLYISEWSVLMNGLEVFCGVFRQKAQVCEVLLYFISPTSHFRDHFIIAQRGLLLHDAPSHLH